MRSHIPLGRVFGIRIGLHYSWFLIAFLISFSLFAQFHAVYPGWPTRVSILLAAVTAVLFFVSLLLHELSHALMAVARGLTVREITLFALGGVSQIEGESPDAKTEFWIAVVGPATSAVIGLACLGLARFAGMAGKAPLLATAAWLGYINLVLAAFNLVPGYPLDGGRILRAALWWKTGSKHRASRMSAKVGQAVAGGLIGFGILQYLGGAGFGGLWLVFIGWFLFQAARQSFMQVGLEKALEDMHVGDLMTRDCATVDGRVSLQDFVDRDLLRTGRHCFVVVEDGKVAGAISPGEVKSVERRDWPFKRVHDAMRPYEPFGEVTPSTSLAKALKLMANNNLNQLPVVSDGHLDGVLSRGEIMDYLQTRTELEA
jgi:Zn-dependent protease/CBS domain-containing protein